MPVAFIYYFTMIEERQLLVKFDTELLTFSVLLFVVNAYVLFCTQFTISRMFEVYLDN